MLKVIVVLFLMGAVIGPLGDLCHVLSKTTAYPDTHSFYFLKIIPYWVPLLFGGASVLIGISHLFADNFFGIFFHASKKRPGAKHVILAFGTPFLFLFMYMMSGYVDFPELVLPITFFLVWYFLDHTWEGALLAALTAFLGTFFEIYLVRQGIFSYQEKANQLFGVAVWLPWLYAMASVSLGNLSRFLYH